MFFLLPFACTPERHPGLRAGSSVQPDDGWTGVEEPSEPDTLAWVTVDAGYHTSCGLLDDQRLVCWGDPDLVEQMPDGPFVSYSNGTDDACALREDGSVSCFCTGWYPGSCDELPDRDDLVEVVSADGYACALDEAQMLLCWGGAEIEAGVPNKAVLDFSAEEQGVCVVFETHQVYCWGNMTEVWAAEAENDPPVLQGPPPELDYIQVSVGRSHVCALDTAGEAHCWGDTGFREPFPQPGPGPYTELFSWNQITCGLRPSGEAECWYDMPGMLDEWFIPDERWAQLGLGEWDACGITLDGRALCFPEPYDSVGEQDVPDLADL